MKLYKVTAKKFTYDEYDSFVIYAYSKQQAKEIAIEKSENRFNGNNFIDADVIEVIEPNKPEILLGSFNAG